MVFVVAWSPSSGGGDDEDQITLSPTMHDSRAPRRRSHHCRHASAFVASDYFGRRRETRELEVKEGAAFTQANIVRKEGGGGGELEEQKAHLS